MTAKDIFFLTESLVITYFLLNTLWTSTNTHKQETEQISLCKIQLYHFQYLRYFIYVPKKYFYSALFQVRGRNLNTKYFLSIFFFLSDCICISDYQPVKRALCSY